MPGPHARGPILARRSTEVSLQMKTLTWANSRVGSGAVYEGFIAGHPLFRGFGHEVGWGKDFT